MKENHEPVAAMASNGSGSSPEAGTSPCGQACEEEEDAAKPDTSNSTQTKLDPPLSVPHPPWDFVLYIVKEEVEWEEQRFQAGQASTKRLYLFEQLVRK